jgi:cysteine desulfurase/selenocysteine lyase
LFKKEFSLFQEAFPVNRELIWLNNCGTTPSSANVLNAIQSFLEGYSKKGIFTEVESFYSVKNEIKSSLVELLGGEPSEYTLIHNTSEGMNIFSYGISLPKNSTILLLEDEYPSNVYPWEHLKEIGHKITFIPVGKSPEEFLNNFEKCITKNVSLVSISAVHWCTGMPLPLKKIGEICKLYNIFFVVDGAQGVGHIPMNVKEMNISFMAFSAWKWLLGPLGLGILYVSKESLDTLKVKFKGTESVLGSESYLPYKEAYKIGTDRYEVSTPSFIDWVYLKASLQLIRSTGFSNVMDRIYQLSKILSDGLREQNFSINSDFFSEKTGIIVANRKDIDSVLAVNYLKENRVISASRLGKIRFAPHAYNTEEQIFTTLSILKKF